MFVYNGVGFFCQCVQTQSHTTSYSDTLLAKQSLTPVVDLPQSAANSSVFARLQLPRCEPRFPSPDNVLCRIFRETQRSDLCGRL